MPEPELAPEECKDASGPQGNKAVLSDADFLRAIQRRLKGESIEKIAEDFGIKAGTLRMRFDRYNVKQPLSERKKALKAIKKERKKLRPDEMRCDNIPLSYRKCLAWATEAAGHLERTGEMPESCPNDVAYYLFLRAREAPKEFLTKLNQMETKRAESEDTLKQACVKSIEDIDLMLATLEEDEDEAQEEAP